MNDSRLSPTAPPEAGAVPLEELAGPAVGESAPAESPPRPEAAARRSGWTAGRITALVVGVLLAMVSLGLLAGGGTALWADRTQRDAGYATTDVHEFATSGSALATAPTHFGSAGAGWLYSPS